VSVKVRDMVKSYGAIRALRGVSLTIEPGTVHALLGPNGAGKSTLIGCMSGAVRPDGGEIVVDGTAHAALTPRAALAAGVSVIYQKFSLVGALSVEDNIFLGTEMTRWGLRRRHEQGRVTAELLARLQRPLPAAAPVATLPIADRQLVEIAKAMRHGSRVLVFDEPTASLSQREAEVLAEQIRALRASGMHILYVTHRLDEVLEIADHVTVLRDGAVVESREVRGMSSAELVRAVTGTDEPLDVAATPPAVGRPVLEVRDAADVGLGPLSLTLHEGELLGVFGMLGSGRTELLETLFGLRPLRDGRIAFDGEDLKGGGPAARIARGIALVPAERVRQSLFMSLTALENVLLPSLRTLAVRVLGLRRRRLERRRFDSVARELRLTPAAPRAPASSFSGGNQQKLAVGRWLVQPEKLRVLLLDEPTQGIDVGTRAELYRILERTAVKLHCGIVFTSSEPEEVVRLAHRAVVLERGRIAAELVGSQITEEALMTAANSAEPEARGPS
jgi:ABC-type sugar transport system ATPase subunit